MGYHRRLQKKECGNTGGCPYGCLNGEKTAHRVGYDQYLTMTGKENMQLGIDLYLPVIHGCAGKIFYGTAMTV